MIYLLISLMLGSLSKAEETSVFPLLMPKIFPEREESYLCTPVRLDEEDSFYIVSFQPNASQHTAHHILVFGCLEPGRSTDVWNCGEMKYSDGVSPCADKPQIIYAWAKEAPKLELPEGVGFKVGKGSGIKYLVLQVHYAHIDNIPRTGDDSGVFLEISNAPLPKQAGVLLLGTGGFAPPHSTTFFETSCEIQDSRTIHPFAFRTHTHGLGKVVSGWKVSPDWNWTLIGKKNPQKPQMFYSVKNSNLTMTKGDIVAARCTMVNHRDRITHVGSTNEDEMCNFYIMYWIEGPPIMPNTCFTQGPPRWSWRGWDLGPGLKNIPDMEASQLEIDEV